MFYDVADKQVTLFILVLLLRKFHVLIRNNFPNYFVIPERWFHSDRDDDYGIVPGILLYVK